MKYKIDILSKECCINLSKENLEQECVIISINDSGYTTIFHNNTKIKDILSLTFDDLSFEMDGFSVFNKPMANQILSFVDAYKSTINHFIVHCTAGISRSAAVGFVLEKYLNGCDAHLFKEGRHIPNKLVYKLMSNSFGLAYDENEFERKLNIKYNITKDSVFKIDFDDDICDIIIN